MNGIRHWCVQAMDKIILILVGAVLTTAFQFLSALLTKTSDKKLKHKDQIKLLSSELEDLIRHCIANLEVLKSIDLDKGIPSDMHFEKMKVMESSILFSSDTYIHIESKYTRYIHRLKIEIRNINLEIDSVLQFKKKADFDIKTLKSYIDYLVLKMQATVNNLPNRLADLTDMDESVLERINIHKEENKNSVRRIVYESPAADKLLLKARLDGIGEGESVPS